MPEPVFEYELHYDQDADSPLTWDSILSEFYTLKKPRYLPEAEHISEHSFFSRFPTDKGRRLEGGVVCINRNLVATLYLNGDDVGWAVMPREKVDSEFNGDIALAAKNLLIEINILDQWVSGEVYGYTIERVLYEEDGEEKEREEVDSLWGLYGREYAEGEAKSRCEGLLEAWRYSDCAAIMHV